MGASIFFFCCLFVQGSGVAAMTPPEVVFGVGQGGLWGRVKA